MPPQIPRKTHGTEDMKGLDDYPFKVLQPDAIGHKWNKTEPKKNPKD
jgi:hypothetical protein